MANEKDAYKFKSLNVFNSDEWMYDATKRYREVFDRSELNYLYAELALYNKFFDEKDWQIDIKLKSYSESGGKKELICELPVSRTITKDENIIFFREGWGNDKFGSFWKKGEYVWEAYVGDELVGSKAFFIMDKGRVMPNKNPYFNVKSIKLYNGPYEIIEKPQRKYVTKFKRDETQYIWVEFDFENLINESWQCELFFNFYDDAGQFKCSNRYFEKILSSSIEKNISIEKGWGNSSGGSWKDDLYCCKIVFMDQLIAKLEFEVGNEFVYGDAPIQFGLTPLKEIISGSKTTITTNQQNSNIISKEPVTEDIMAELDGLIGLKSIKDQIKNYLNFVNFVQLRKEKGIQETQKICLHSVFTGNPGTGKTTIVKMLGKIYKSLGLLSKGHVVEVDRAALVAEYIGQTAPKVKESIESARGGVLFIDEAYALTRNNEDGKDFGKEVIEILLKEMSDGPGDIAIMVAGYPKEMELFMQSNPGLKSRFANHYDFPDYMPDELMEISLNYANKNSLKFAEDSKAFLFKKLTDAYRDRDSTFGNARYAISLVTESNFNMGLRIMQSKDAKSLSVDELTTILLCDIQKIFGEDQEKILKIQIDETLLQLAKDELNSLIGLTELKHELFETIKLVRYYLESGRDVLNRFSLHSVFTGNPGTGKTTVARIIAKIYKALGLLERGHLVECDRSALVAGYIGQTAIKTKQMLSKAMQGVLFIDEAYSLASFSEEDFGKEAIETILKEMEDQRGKFSVVVAGYPDNMHTFIESNPGLKSRFDKTYVFPDYNADELFSIAVKLLANENLLLNIDAESHLKIYIQHIYDNRDKFFGNARTIRQIVGEIIKDHDLRMASLEQNQRTTDVVKEVTLEDVKDFIPTELKKGATLGFRIVK